jgi:hypothetical protein
LVLIGACVGLFFVFKKICDWLKLNIEFAWTPHKVITSTPKKRRSSYRRRSASNSTHRNASSVNPVSVTAFEYPTKIQEDTPKAPTANSKELDGRLKEIESPHRDWTNPQSLPDKLICPRCKLINPPSALRCDCDYIFNPQHTETDTENVLATKPTSSFSESAGSNFVDSEPETFEIDISALDPITRAAVGPVEVRQLHKQMQHEIFYCLQCKGIYKRQVIIEVDGIDILVQELEIATIIEIKTGTDCVMVLREAIGQLLEYQFFAQDHFKGKSVRLIAVSPLPLDNRAANYLRHLKQSYHLEIEYRQYVPGSFVFTI